MNFSRLHKTLWFFGVFFLCVFYATGNAQNLALPILEVSPRSLPENGAVTLSLPPGAVLPAKRVKLTLYEWNHEQPAAEIWRIMELRDGRWQTTVNVSADPGVYEFRLVTTDKIPRPLTAKAESPNFIVPGVARVPGWWLPDGLPFVFLPKAGAISAPNAPLFVTGLQRDSGRKSPPSQNTIPISGATPAWRALPLPALRDMLATGFDWAALKTDLAKRVSEAQNRGERGFWGWSLTPGAGKTSLFGADKALSQLNGILTEISPGAALIYEVDTTKDVAQAARNLEGTARFCDAVLLRVPDNDSAFWALKTARRIAEEQPNYDLPVLVRVEGKAAPSRETLRLYLMAGATGFILDETLLNADVHRFKDEIARDASLWIGAVTLEDTGVLPPPDAPDTVDDEMLLQFVSQLRAIGRVPLLARADSISKPETLMLKIGNRISSATIDRLEKIARAGARIYIEGTPTADETGQATSWKLSTLVGAEITAIPTRRSTMTLDDPWVFGTVRGTRVPVEQSFSIKLQPSSMAAQAKVKKGELTETGPRAVATLEDGSPALIINVLGKGEVVWLPHRLTKGEAPVVSAQDGVPTAVAPGTNPTRNLTEPWQKYLSGVADYVSPRLVQQRAPEGSTRPLDLAPIALRRSAKGTFLLWLNRKKGATPAEIVTEGASAVALELNDLKNISTTTRGFQTTFTIEATGDVLLALAPTQKELDAERNAPRAKAKLR